MNPPSTLDGAGDSGRADPLSNRGNKQFHRRYILRALNNVHEIFADPADLMLQKFRDMDEAWKSTAEWCTTLEHIKRGEMRDEEIEEYENQKQKANKLRIFEDSPYKPGM